MRSLTEHLTTVLLPSLVQEELLKRNMTLCSEFRWLKTAEFGGVGGPRRSTVITFTYNTELKSLRLTPQLYLTRIPFNIKTLHLWVNWIWASRQLFVSETTRPHKFWPDVWLSACRTDGGHNCVGPDKSYRSCNIQVRKPVGQIQFSEPTRSAASDRFLLSFPQDCPEGSKDFREEQCSQFDGTDFQGKRYKWLPYYGGRSWTCSYLWISATIKWSLTFILNSSTAENPCELNCMPTGENFFYRHRSAVVDGTPCHPGRRDICVDGVCKVSEEQLWSQHELLSEVHITSAGSQRRL